MRYFVVIFFIALSVLINIKPASSLSFDVVMTANGGLVLSSFGDCVRTKWTSDKDFCPSFANFQAEMQEMLKTQKGVVNFDFDSSRLKDAEKPKLDGLIELFKKYKIENIRIYGYTDKIGKDQYNLNLSQKRALSVYDYLQSQLNIGKDYTLPLDVKGVGKANPIKECSHEEKGQIIQCLQPNRRAEVEMDYHESVAK